MRALPKNFRPAQLPLSLQLGPCRCTLRRLRHDDVQRLIVFFHSHSEETIQQRYGYHLTQMSPERAIQLVGISQQRDAALGLLERQGRGSRLVAVGRYCLRPDGESAEMAFVVHEQRRRLGLATILLRALIAIARQHPDRFEFRRLHEFLFQPVVLRYIAKNQHRTHDLSIMIVDWGDRLFDKHLRSVTPDKHAV